MATRPQDSPTALPGTDQGPNKPPRYVQRNPDKPVPSLNRPDQDKKKEQEGKTMMKEGEDTIRGGSTQQGEKARIGGLKPERHSHTHLIALDGSANSNAAFSWANKNLPKQDRFILYSAIRRVPYVEGPLEGVDLDARERLLEKYRKERSQLFDRYKRECAESQVPTYFVLMICGDFLRFL